MPPVDAERRVHHCRALFLVSIVLRKSVSDRFDPFAVTFPFLLPILPVFYYMLLPNVKQLTNRLNRLIQGGCVFRSFVFECPRDWKTLVPTQQQVV